MVQLKNTTFGSQLFEVINKSKKKLVKIKHHVYIDCNVEENLSLEKKIFFNFFGVNYYKFI